MLFWDYAFLSQVLTCASSSDTALAAVFRKGDIARLWKPRRERPCDGIQLPTSRARGNRLRRQASMRMYVLTTI